MHLRAGPTGLENGQATIDEAYLEYCPTAQKPAAGRFRPPPDDIMKKSLDQNDSPTSTLRGRRCLAAWRKKLDHDLIASQRPALGTLRRQLTPATATRALACSPRWNPARWPAGAAHDHAHLAAFSAATTAWAIRRLTTIRGHHQGRGQWLVGEGTSSGSVARLAMRWKPRVGKR